MTTQEKKNLIRRFIKKEKVIDSPLGNIDVKEQIGEGGNAIVYNAQFGQNQVALKLLAEEKDSQKYKRFITEFREIVQLVETGAVVPIYYLGHIEIESYIFPYIVMKKYPLTLKSWKAENTITNFDDLKGVLKNLLEILLIIHDNKIVHRDLKPENILVSDSGEMVLADFGISWFDPEFYERIVHTGKSDRMANYDFSAPEQFEKGSIPHASMDIFALGQIVTWLITGGVARGARTPLQQFDESFIVIEPVINQMLVRSSDKRQQSIQEVIDTLSENITRMSQRRKQQDEINFVINNLKKYDDILRYCFPGKRGLIETDDKLKIEKVLKQLNTFSKDNNLWWTKGRGDMPIEKFEQLDEDTWLMDYTEIQIEKMWALKDSYSLDHQFILIKTKAMSNFNIYEGEASYREEAAWFMDRYISRDEYDDGVADIDGESVILEGRADLRVRNLETQYYFIASCSHPVILPENNAIVSEVYEKLLATNNFEQDDIERLTALKRDRISIMMS
ncbi:UNVERIFIED_ORG: serine/threonine-protein kinase [Bacillus cereus]